MDYDTTNWFKQNKSVETLLPSFSNNQLFFAKTVLFCCRWYHGDNGNADLLLANAREFYI
jgi:hypothetical protein